MWLKKTSYKSINLHLGAILLTNDKSFLVIKEIRVQSINV